eukprot:scaffold3121_cov211-Skeletonema_marinoi.AAC.5
MSLRGTLNNIIGSGSSQAASSDGKLLKLVSKNDDTKSALFPTNDPLRFNLHSSQQQQQYAASSSESSSELKLLRRLTLTNSSKEEEQWGDGDDDDDFASTATNEAPLLVKGTAGGSDDVKLLDNNETNENNIEKIDGGTDDKVVVEESTQVEEEEFQNNTTVVADEEVMAASLMNVTNNGGSGDDDDEVTIDIAASTTNNGNNNSTADQLVENEGMKASSDSELTAPPSSTSSMLDLSSFTQATTLCQDDPTFIHPVYNQTCVDLVGEDESKCEVDYSEVRVVDNSDGVEEGEKMLKVKDICKSSCGLCDDDDDDDIDTITEQEELKLDEEEMDQLLKDSSKQGTTNETMVVDEEGVQEEEEEDESGDENVDKKNASGIDTVEEEELAVKMADEDDAFIPDEEVVEVAVGGEGGIEEDLDSTGTGDEVKEEDNEEEAVSVTDENDDQQLEEETESKAEIALDEGTDDEEMAEKLEEEMEEALDEELVQPKEEGEEIEAASETEDESVLCQDDPEFEYKGYEGFNCAYIKEKKPDKCDKKHQGVKVGLSSCPVSCDMVDECMALQKQTNAVVVSSADETTTEKSAEAIADEQVSEDNSDDSAMEQKDDLQLEKEMESELETALEQGTVDEETAEILDEEMLEALEEGVGGVFEKELEEELGLDSQKVSDDLSKEKTATEVDDDNNLATIDSSFTEDASSVVANVTISEDDSSVCQDDPDFKFKGYEGFNCEYIKENKPGKCNKMFDGEKVGVVSCPVSCDMVDECMALRESKVDDALENATDNNVMGSNTTSEEDAVLTNTTAEASDDTNDQLLVEGSEDTQVGAVLNTTEIVTLEEEAVAIEAGTEEEEDLSEELLKEQNITSSDEQTNETDETDVLCQDDPAFKFKGYEGINCEYIKENKPGKCNKMFDGEKVGVVSCPVSCDMVDECMALRDSKVGAALEHALDNNETLSNTTSEEDAVLTNTTANEIADEGTENTDALEGTEDDEASDDTKAQLVGGSGDTQVDAAGNTTEVVTSKEEAVVTEQTDTETEDDGSEELLDEQNTAYSEEDSNETDETTVLCQDDPDFKFKGYEDFNCEYIKENKPEKCNKLHDGEKVGVVSCPVSCDMVDECMALQDSKVGAALEHALDNNETLSNTTSEEDAAVTNTTANEIADEGTENTDALEGTEDDEASDDTNDQLLVEGSEDTQVGAVLNTTEVVTSETETETSEELLKEQNTTSVDYSQATTIPSETQQVDDETGEDQILNDQELEQEIEAKLEKALEDGELDEEEAQELEYEMEEAIEEGVGKIFEAELDKELRCKDDPDFAIVDEDGQLRNCSWVRPNQRCESVHEYSGKVIGTFFCPETCGMEDECEKVTAANSTLQAPEDKTPGTEEDDSFEATPKGTKSMADEIEIESEFENGNVYGSENVDPFSGGDTEAGSFTNQNEYNQEPNSNVGYSQPTNGVEDWQGYGGENQQEGGSFDNNPPPIDYDENWLEDDSGFPFGFLILLFLGVGFFIFRKSQSSRLQENSRGGYQRVGGRIDIQDHNKRY